MYWSSWLTMIPEPQLSCGCDAVYPYQVLTCFSLIFVIATIDGITLSAISETSVKSVTALDEVFAALTVSPLLLLFREASVLADSELLHFVPSNWFVPANTLPEINPKTNAIAAHFASFTPNPPLPCSFFTFSFRFFFCWFCPYGCVPWL